MRVSVSLARCESYDPVTLADCLARAGDEHGFDTGFTGKTVLLKPNLISSRGDGVSCTQPELIRAAADYFLARGGRVLLGDSPAFGSCRRICELRGISEILAGTGVELIDFTETRKVRLDCGLTLPIARAALEADLLVNLPRIKAHQQLFVTLAVKNLFGTVVGPNKAMLHMREGGGRGQFVQALLDLHRLFPDQLHIIDGIMGMHRTGPIHGDPIHLGCVGISRNPVALDRAVLELLELDPDRSPLARLARKQGIPGARLAEIDFPELGPTAFHGSGFVAPDSLAPIRFNPLNFVFGMVRRLWMRLAGGGV